jgi:prepilin-type N-terminal cleavage/methylation domain-containing protein
MRAALTAPGLLPLRRAFTFLEVMIVVVIIGILAAIVVPQFAGATQDAKSAALISSLGGVRTSIAGFRTNAILSGTAQYPTLVQLNTVGVVLQDEMPANPFNGLNAVQTVNSTAATNRTVSNPTQYGWNYHVDNSSNPPRAVFYANSSDVVDSQGTTANEK